MDAGLPRCEIGKICMFLVLKSDEPIMELKPRDWVSPTNATTFPELCLHSATLTTCPSCVALSSFPDPLRWLYETYAHSCI